MSYTRRTLLAGGKAVAATTAASGVTAGQETGPNPDVPDAQVVGDTGSERITVLEYESELGAVRRYHSIAGEIATGVEVYIDGERIEEREPAGSYLEDAGWVLAIDTIRREDGSGLSERADRLAGEIIDRTELIADLLATPEEVLATIVDGIDELQSIGVTIGESTITLWDIATQQFPFLSTFETIVRELNERIGGWRDVATTVNENVPPFLSELDALPPRYRPPSERFRSRARSAQAALEALREQTDGLRDDIEGLREQATQIVAERARIATELINELDSRTGGAVPNQVRTTVNDFAEGLVALAEDILDRIVEPVLEPIESFGQLVTDTRDELAIAETARDRTDQLVQAWERRRDGERVAVTGGAASLGGFALLLLIGWMLEVDELNDEVSEDE